MKKRFNKFSLFRHYFLQIYLRLRYTPLLPFLQYSPTKTSKPFFLNNSNGKIEGMNSKLRGFSKRAFGFKTLKNLKITIFIALGKLNLIPA
ncbi:transposase [Petrotoga mobilis]|uniref:transposase n=1 Tax=Petrotoga mobilis TaxID=69499 RepID=UPI0038B33496